MKKVLLGGLGIVMLLTACHKDDNNNNSNRTLNATDSSFIMNTAKGNRGEIMAGQLAASKGTNASVKSFGQFMVTEHTQAQTDLQNIGSNLNYNLPNGVTPEDSALMVRLNSLSGTAFDTAYINSQVMDHQKTITIFQTEISNGMQQDVKSYANNYLPHIQMHLQRADSISRTLR